jgi:hypothetical protein
VWLNGKFVYTYWNTMPASFVPRRLPLGATATRTARSVRALRLALIDAIAEHLARTAMPQGELAAMLKPPVQ